MENMLKEAYLYDFYGELLTAHQQKLFEAVVLEDLSLGEAAERFSVSRQAVYDQLRRARKTLAGYEEKLGLLDRFLRLKAQLSQLQEILGQPSLANPEENFRKALRLTEHIMEEL